jgi:hypothetical protein
VSTDKAPVRSPITCSDQQLKSSRDAIYPDSDEIAHAKQSLMDQKNKNQYANKVKEEWELETSP